MILSVLYKKKNKKKEVLLMGLNKKELEALIGHSVEWDDGYGEE